MAVDRIQRQRFENKYMINEGVALKVRDFISSYLEPDEYGSSQPNYSYPVHSLYLDSPDLKLYQNTINGDKNRYKLRIRFYENGEDAPVYFEIKRRSNNIINKQRSAIKREAAEAMVSGQIPALSQMASNEPHHYEAAREFCRLANHLQAEPKVHVTYLREAWMTRGSNSVRVTIDRQVQSEPVNQVSFETRLNKPRSVFGDGVVLELKFTNRYPHWFQEMVQAMGLRQGSAAKYVDGVWNMGENRFLRAYV